MEGFQLAKRIDQNQPDMVKAFRKAGMTVQILSDVGKGCPDILVGYRGQNYLVEIKNGNKKLTPHEEVFFANWKGQVIILRSLDDVCFFIENLIDN